MVRKAGFILLILFSACKVKNNHSTIQKEIENTLIEIETKGGFTGGSGTYTFNTEGFISYQGDSMRELKAKELNTLKRQIALIRELPAYQTSSQVIKRSLILFDQQDTLSFSWDLEDESAARYNKIYRRLSQIIIE
jgi:hypothetical protein